MVTVERVVLKSDRLGQWGEVRREGRGDELRVVVDVSGFSPVGLSGVQAVELAHALRLVAIASSG